LFLLIVPLNAHLFLTDVMTELQQVKSELAEIKMLLKTLLQQNAPVALSVSEKAKIMSDALRKSRETNDRSHVRAAQKEINQC